MNFWHPDDIGHLALRYAAGGGAGLRTMFGRRQPLLLLLLLRRVLGAAIGGRGLQTNTQRNGHFDVNERLLRV